MNIKINIFLTFFSFLTILSIEGQETNRKYLIDVNSIGSDTLNYIPFANAKTISITGDKYTISEEYTPELFAFKDSHDISEVNIYGRVIKISSSLHFPHSRIKIYCDSLIFERNQLSQEFGSINNTPLKHHQSRANQFEDGIDGLDAKPILISAKYIEKTFEDNPNGQIISNGGDGQDAGYGRNGKQGKSYPVIKCKCAGCEGSASTEVALSGKPYTFYKNLVYEDGCPTDARKGTKAWPDNGENAVAGGKPGEGGNGGDLYINNLNTFYNKNVFESTQFGAMYSVNPGNVGAVASEEDYKGGAPGAPEVARWWLKRGGVKTHISKKGKDVENPKPKFTATKGGYLDFGTNDIFRTQPSKVKFWVHPEYLRFKYFELIELIKLKEYEIFQQEFYSIEKIINDHENILEPIFAKIPATWDTYYLNNEFTKTKRFTYLSKRENNDLKNIIFQIKKLKHDYDLGLDFYGKPLNWAPMLSFEYNYAIFNNEVEIAINEIYISEWISSEKTSIENKLIGLIELAQIQNKKIEHSKISITESLDKIPDIKSRALKLKHKTDLLLLELNEIEKELQKLAETTVEERRRKAKMYKLLKTASTLLKSSPVGQPYTAAVGIGIDIINQYDYSEDGWDGFNSVNNIYDDLSEIDWQEKRKSWKKYKRDYKNLDKIETLDKVYSDFFKPLENDIAALKIALSNRKIKDSDINKELEKLKSENEIFKKLAVSIKEITEDRALLIKELEFLTFKIYNECSHIIQNENLLGNIAKSISNKQFILSRSNRNVIKGIKDNALSKLDYYSYLLVKSYEYRFLRDFPNQYYNSNIYDNVKDMVVENNFNRLLTDDQKNKMIDAYLIDLRKITSQIILDYNSGLFNKNTRKYIPLSKKQVQDLNDNGVTTLDLNNSDFFDLNRENNLRLTNINIVFGKSNFEIQPANIEFGEIDIFISHSGDSKIIKNNKPYLYSHYGPKTQSKYTWGARYSIHQNSINQINISPSDYSLLNTILAEFSSSKYITIFSRPGLLSSYKIELNKNILNLEDFKINGLTLELIYDYE